MTGISPKQNFFKMAEQKNVVKISYSKFTSDFKMSVIKYAKKENIKVTARKYKLLSLLSKLSMFLYIESVIFKPLSNKSPLLQMELK